MFEGISIATLTPPALLGLGVLMLLLGRIVPRSNLKDWQDEALRWREAYEAEREARLISSHQVSELMEVTKTTRGLIVAMYGTAERIRGSEGLDVVSAPAPEER